MKRYFKNNRGVALLMVVSFVTIMSVAVLDLLSGSLTSHQVALNAEKRVQAYYLARSSINFSKLILYYSQKLKSQVDEMGVSASTLQSVGYQPLYKMFPLSTALFRGLVATAPVNSEGEGSGAVPLEEIPTADGEQGQGGSEEGYSAPNFLQKDKMNEFLSFSGDFDSEISEETSKYSLNTVSAMDPKAPEYDLYKKILLQILMGPDYKNFFEVHDKDAETLVHALADFVDGNKTINEFDQVERGSESGLYHDVDYSVKNSKFLTLSEMRLVAGMSDDIFASLAPQVTVYHTSSTVNVCLSEPEVLDALIVYYTTYGECTTPIQSDDTETLTMLRNEILSYCPDTSAMATALNIKLGLTSAEAVEVVQEAGTAESRQSSAQVAECQVQFEKLITETNDIFKIEAHGTVDEVNRTITLVLDTQSNTPSTWKTLYYHVQ